MTTITEKKKTVSKSSRKAVYKADYEKTKNKPYRQYDPSEQDKALAEELLEGMWDFIKGAGSHIGQSVKQGVAQAVEAGQTESKTAAIKKAVAVAIDIGRQFRNIRRPGASFEPKDEPQQERREPVAKQQPARTSQQQGQFQQNHKPKMIDKNDGYGRQYQFSSYLQQTEHEFITEGMWDFIKGAGKSIGASAVQGAKNTYQAGRQQSLQADEQKQRRNQRAEQIERQKRIEQMRTTFRNSVSTIVQIMSQLNDEKKEQVMNFIKSHGSEATPLVMAIQSKM